jgi:hypothetical protein
LNINNNKNNNNNNNNYNKNNNSNDTSAIQRGAASFVAQYRDPREGTDALVSLILTKDQLLIAKKPRFLIKYIHIFYKWVSLILTKDQLLIAKKPRHGKRGGERERERERERGK